MRDEANRAIAAALGRAGIAAIVDDSTLTRAIYSSDASLYRVPPLAVARPRHDDDVEALVAVARQTGVPLTARGSGTSCAGNAVGPGIVVDLSGLDRIVDVDPDARTAVVQPGVVQADLQRAAAPFQLRFGPDPSTSTRCTIGGMIGNNACGPRALGYGRTADNLVAATMVTGAGQRIGTDAATWEPAARVVAAHAEAVRREFGTFSRQVSGYSLEHLLPERLSPAAFVAGTEGTLGILTQATVRLAVAPERTVLVALGYPSMADAADAVPGLLRFDPIALEGLDDRIVDVVRRRKGAAAVPELPRGRGYLIIELGGDDASELLSRGRALAAASGALDSLVVPQGPVAAALWRIRADGAGLAAVGLAKPAHAGWEDAAVPPAHLGVYLREVDALLTAHGLDTLPYGHFGEGCVHGRIDFPLGEPGGTSRYHDFVVEAARLVARHGGSMSGEHGDGRARSELLPIMYSAEALGVFAQIKGLFDPQSIMNPGVLVEPRPLDADVRLARAALSPLSRAHPEFAAHAQRCTGVGACVSHQPGATMCPSYRATGQQKDSTRGRARTLQEMLDGELITGGWDSPEVAAALDLCLACKACRRECPTGVDIASLKSEALDHRYRGKRRPRTHYTLGWLPFWLRLARRIPIAAPLINAVGNVPGIGHAIKFAAGVDTRRRMPRFEAPVAPPASTGSGQPIMVWVDSFTPTFSPRSVAATVAVLRAAGFDPQVITDDACCGLTWITTGQLDAARAKIRHALDVLHPIVAAGIPVVGMEPSCLAVWRSDAGDLLPGDARVGEVAAGIRTLAETLGGWQPPRLDGHTVVAQPHCHHGAVLGWAADAALLARTGARVVTVDGCCGLAGNFGMERGHYETSVAAFDNNLGPAIRAAGTGAILLADGFSCRTQVADLTDQQALTLAEVLASHLAPTATPHPA